MPVKIFTINSPQLLEHQINEFLQELESYEIVDRQLDTCFCTDSAEPYVMYTVLLSYRSTKQPPPCDLPPVEPPE